MIMEVIKWTHRILMPLAIALCMNRQVTAALFVGVVGLVAGFFYVGDAPEDSELSGGQSGG